LRAYRWPGNVRELSHELERAIVFEESPELDFAHLPASAGAPPPPPPAAAAATGGSWLDESFRFPEEGFRLEETIDQLMQKALDQAEGNVSAAARLLGVPRDYVRYRVNQKNRKPDGN
jgi:DNA-binding NtrC family response regulator